MLFGCIWHRWEVLKRIGEHHNGFYHLGVIQCTGFQHTLCVSYATSIVTSQNYIWARLCPRRGGPSFSAIGWKFQTSKHSWHFGARKSPCPFSNRRSSTPTLVWHCLRGIISIEVLLFGTTKVLWYMVTSVVGRNSGVHTARLLGVSQLRHSKIGLFSWIVPVCRCTERKEIYGSCLQSFVEVHLSMVHGTLLVTIKYCCAITREQ